MSSIKVIQDLQSISAIELIKADWLSHSQIYVLPNMFYPASQMSIDLIKTSIMVSLFRTSKYSACTSIQPWRLFYTHKYVHDNNSLDLHISDFFLASQML